MNRQLFYTAIQEEQYFPIGFFKKPIGIDGRIVAALSHELDPTEVAKLPALFVEIDHIKVPYTIQNIVLTEHKTIIQLNSIPSKTEAYLLRNLPLWLPLSLQSKLISRAASYNFLVGYLVVDQILGELGKIQTIYCVRDQYMVAIDYKENALLVPQPFVVSVDDQQQKVMVKLPEGYLAAMF